MASSPSSHAGRRSGHSRRAQFGQFTGYVIAGIGALIGALLLAVSLIRPATFGPVRGEAIDIVEPAAETVAVARSESQGMFEAIGAYYRAGSKNAELRREVELARIKLAEAQAVERQNERLKGLMGLTENDGEAVAIARLIGSSATSSRRIAYLGAGTDEGVRPGMPVRSERGVLGRVLEASSDSARVLLLTDSDSYLPVRRATDDVAAIAQGRGDGLLRVRLINLGLNPLKKGDIFVTSGAGGYYRPGTAVAIVVEVTEDGALARIISDPAATGIVRVDPIYEPEAAELIGEAAAPSVQSNETDN
ncbi:Cell shape-determining protein MreC [Alteripontixanthobacter maritimus]|uniref:Cell shape-determining protein MreC n=1 Tax=Alteripontixanthobacter maritimus TaxID=2161824 RepID=A0A369Q9F1_9SPHN|nr:rod shape-determining protein MreC [Alteripontixanthobacter maritimus]RDC59887.1 Cell shape-determining protein MreC [Alteripontixanthobacter maritimus]